MRSSCGSPAAWRPAASTRISTPSIPPSRCSSPASRRCSTCTAGAIGPAAKVIEVADRVLKAYEDIGMRVSYSYALRDQNRLVYEADEAFAARFPAPVSGRARQPTCRPRPSRSRTTSASSPTCGRSCGRNTRARARVQLAPANLHWCSDEALAALRDWSAKYQVGMHMHLVETAYQREYARRRTGRTAFRHLRGPRPARVPASRSGTACG